jgi:hypothetical protein
MHSIIKDALPPNTRIYPERDETRRDETRRDETRRDSMTDRVVDELVEENGPNSTARAAAPATLSDETTSCKRGAPLDENHLKHILEACSASGVGVGGGDGTGRSGGGGGGGDIHIGQRIYVQDGGASTRNDDVQIVDTSGGGGGQYESAPRGFPSATGRDRNTDSVEPADTEWSKRDYVTCVVFMSMAVIFLILIYVSIRQSKQASPKQGDDAENAKLSVTMTD